MGSLLFKEVREKRGLAYAVSGDMDYFSDAGAAYLYAGVNAEKAEEAIVTIKEIAKSLKTELLTEERLNKAKEFIRGIILYVTDGVEKSGNWYTTKSLLDPKYLNPEDYLNAVAAVTPQDVLRVANSIFKPENESLTIIGPFKDEEKFAKILTNTK
jgi:predicted Zn-dependent peptidase